MKKVCVTDYHYESLKVEQDAIESAGAVFAPMHLEDEEQLVPIADQYDVFINTYVQLTERSMSKMKPGAAIIRYGVGVDNVNLDHARKCGVHVCNIPDYGLVSVAEYTLSAITGLFRKLQFFDAKVRRSDWSYDDCGPLRNFDQCTVGLMGFGGIARTLARYLRAVGFTVIVHDPFVPADAVKEQGCTPASFEEVLAQADLISLHMPLTDTTRHLMNSETMAAMKDGAYLVNTARGPLVNGEDLAVALSSGKLGAAVLDVTEQEPLPLDSPLFSAPNLTLTPHVAWYNEQSLERIHILAAEEAVRAIRGEKLRCALT
ncbi:MAG: C-terminal binding protein [Desulfovibrio sp.]|uniref:C-terminal binding protein n=1 Tax=Desulfovibrio sp. 7SRBS1 TaxID=3378064 RepID=UPI003B41835A